MVETYEFRIFEDYYHLLPKPNNAKFNGACYVLKIPKENFLYEEIDKIDKKVRKKHGESFFGFWYIKRQYSKNELIEAELLNLKIKTTFEPTGEDCGTVYDETVVCEICGSNRKQVSPLVLKKGSIPKKDIARTIGSEVIVSSKLVNAVKRRNLKGFIFSPIYFTKGTSDYYQLSASNEIELSSKTITGINPFNFSKGSEEFTSKVWGYEVKYEKEVYVCPNGDLIGLNQISEAYVLNNELIGKFDFLASRQKIGVKRGFLVPEPLYFCSQAFRQMVIEEKLSGFEFEVAHIV